MSTESDMSAMLDSLSATLAAVQQGRDKTWKDVCAEIRSICQSFEHSRFATPQDRQSAW